MKLLEGKVALVTGAGRGIGKAIALRFAQEGANVAFTDLAINEAVEQTVKEIEALGVKAKAYASNAANFDETHEVVKQIVEDFGRIDVLVNNAGITKDGLMMRMSEAQWDAVINVNLKSAFNFIHAVTPIMAKQRGLLFKTLKELCLIPAPSHMEQNRAEYCKKYLESVGAKGVYIDEALNVVFPLNCENSNEITVVVAHTDTVFPDTEPMPYKDDGEKIYCPGVGGWEFVL